MRNSRYWSYVFRLAVCFACVCAGKARAVVFINEVSINPPGSLDTFREYIEFMGTPGMKLDGYAVALLNGAQQKLYPLGSIPPIPNPAPEIDEFFSLDGLALGANGLLVIAIAGIDNYPEVLSDTAFHGPWDDIWNGGLDVPGKLNNDGSNTVMLIRNRPGQTQADPTNSGALRWGKSVRQDFQFITDVVDPSDGMLKDQFGDGEIDTGKPDGFGGVTLDLKGKTTADIKDDLEIVDEISYEDQQGWEYDVDKREADIDSPVHKLKQRHVHTLLDPQGFNPDSLTRVDYRTTGAGWVPVDGATGEMPNGNNWQDTATEQWIRGENTVVFGDSIEIYYSNDLNSDPEAIQPFLTNVPDWLHDGVGQDYNFLVADTYPLWAGRTNPLAVLFIPGDADRDGDCDIADIAKLAAVFGNNNWIFSNSFGEAPMGDSGDPAAQTRPWDVDATGDNGIEASDLQWSLNFQGNTNGRIVGVRYDSPTPSATGVAINPNSSVSCTVSAVTTVPSGHPINQLQTGDFVQLTVRAQVTGGANNGATTANGVMQFIHDVNISQGGVLRVESITPLAPYSITRQSLISLQGANGDTGAALVNGYTTDFTRGLGSTASLYRVDLLAIGLGSANVTIVRAHEPKFVASTPGGLKVGHTDHNGNPNSVVYPSAISIAVTSSSPSLGNCDGDPLITLVDYACFRDCLNGPGGGIDLDCELFDLNSDGDVDLADFAMLARMFGGQ